MGTRHLRENRKFRMVQQVVRAIPFGTEASENMGCDLRGCNFLLFLVCSAYVDVICSGSFCYFVKFYSLMQETIDHSLLFDVYTQDFQPGGLCKR